MSTTVFFSTVPRPTSTLGMTTESSIVQQSWTRTFENSSDRRTIEPLMMQPLATIESIAVPRRPSSSNTNFAGGSCSWYVQIGQSWS